MQILITGGAGFIGSNASDALLADGHEVIIFDNLSRPGSESNVRWLRQRRGELRLIRADVRHSSPVIRYSSPVYEWAAEQEATAVQRAAAQR